jgi:hypothetical protein
MSWRLWLVAVMLMVGTGFAEPRRQVGRVGDVPVYADQITGQTATERANSARALFTRQALADWYAGNAAATALSDDERRMLIAQIEAYAACSGNGYTLPTDPAWREAALQMLGGNAKVQKRLYDQFGGGRLLFQQAGVEAFDATRRLLEQREREGAFTFTDPAVRALAYDYWTRDHGAFLISDPAKIARALDVRSAIATCPPA